MKTARKARPEIISWSPLTTVTSGQYMEWYYTINANGNLVRRDPYLRSTPVDGSVYSQRCDEQ